MTPIARIRQFCMMHGEVQRAVRPQLLEALEEFLKTCKKEDLSVLNYVPSVGEEEPYYGLLLPAEAIAMIAAYANRFYNK